MDGLHPVLQGQRLTSIGGEAHPLERHTPQAITSKGGNVATFAKKTRQIYG
jgi:hypothetical protein